MSSQAPANGVSHPRRNAYAERGPIVDAALQSIGQGVIHGYQLLTKNTDKSSPPPSFGLREISASGALRASASKSRSSK